MFLDKLYFTMVDIGMALELHHLDSESICCCGAGAAPEVVPAGHRLGWGRSVALFVFREVLISVFREMKKYQKDFSSWCAECKREKMERQSQSVKATKLDCWRDDDLNLTYSVYVRT
ncbi:hypothetical protein PR202_gb29409 [Eleusine coracana subsp. coracana]|uniref:Uncharacterized protein n=1 Tax=Eleusine coracana subsp. coracana TaxID=191504 RepID=A0AAV5G0F1_ELECO|nr:hypothetical protein PR202_gb29409 [Eleusine coracana subsp. coracana]